MRPTITSLPTGLELMTEADLPTNVEDDMLEFDPSSYPPPEATHECDVRFETSAVSKLFQNANKERPCARAARAQAREFRGLALSSDTACPKCRRLYSGLGKALDHHAAMLEASNTKDILRHAQARLEVLTSLGYSQV